MASDPCATCGRSNCANPGWLSWGYLQCRDVAYEREKARTDAAEALQAQDGAIQRQIAEALAAARRECEGLREALRNIVGVWKEIHDDAKQRRMWILGWETWLKVIAEGTALAAPAAGDSK